MTNTADEIQHWFKKTGYPLEMQAASTLARAGFSVRQATMYTDPVSGTSRDIDVHAFKSNFFGDVAVSLVVECKKSEKPWVVLTSPYTLRDFNRLFALGLSTTGVRKELVNGGAQHAFFVHIAKADRCGYSLKQAMSGEKDHGYSACTGVIAAARATLQVGTRSSPEAYHLVLPVVVVDAPLFESELDESGEIHLAQVESSRLLYGWDGGGPGPTCINIVSLQYLSEFARQHLKIAEELIGLVEEKPVDQRLREQKSEASQETPPK